MINQEHANTTACITCQFQSCPDCGNILLKEWEIGSKTVALCHVCGTVFVRETGEVIVVLVGEEEKWETKALTSAILLT